jgi:hypothetical protein
MLNFHKLGFREFLKVIGGPETRLLTAQKDFFSFQDRKAEIEMCITDQEYVDLFLGTSLDEASHFFRHFYEVSCENLRNSNFQFEAQNENGQLTIYSLADPNIQKWADSNPLKKWLQISSLNNWQLNQGF